MAALFVGKKIYPIVEIARCLKYWFSAKNIADLKNQYFFFSQFFGSSVWTLWIFFCLIKIHCRPFKDVFKMIFNTSKGSWLLYLLEKYYFQGSRLPGVWNIDMPDWQSLLIWSATWNEPDPGFSKLGHFTFDPSGFFFDGQNSL